MPGSRVLLAARLVARGYQLSRAYRVAGVSINGMKGVKTEWVKVGRWMSSDEYEKMRSIGRVIESRSGATHVASPANIGTFARQASKRNYYVEFSVPRASLNLTSKGVAQISGPNSVYGRLAIKKGLKPPKMPHAANTKHIATKW